MCLSYEREGHWRYSTPVFRLILPQADVGNSSGKRKGSQRWKKPKGERGGLTTSPMTLPPALIQLHWESGGCHLACLQPLAKARSPCVAQRLDCLGTRAGQPNGRAVRRMPHPAYFSVIFAAFLCIHAFLLVPYGSDRRMIVVQSSVVRGCQMSALVKKPPMIAELTDVRSNAI